ncbi:MAG: GNAT family N-acetyltransferase [Formosimonas sp.]
MLTAHHITLTPIQTAHFAPLYAIVAAHPELYQYTTLGQTEASFQKWFDLALKDGAFVVLDNASHAPIGSTRLYNLNPKVPQANLGYTWYAPQCIGTAVNPEAKLLLLSHAFETLGLHRVGFEVDSRNARSCQAVRKLGASAEGVLRQHRRGVADGVLCDTSVFSILDSEWPSVKAGLQRRIGGAT